MRKVGRNEAATNSRDHGCGLETLGPDRSLGTGAGARSYPSTGCSTVRCYSPVRCYPAVRFCYSAVRSLLDRCGIKYPKLSQVLNEVSEVPVA